MLNYNNAAFKRDNEFFGDKDFHIVVLTPYHAHYGLGFVNKPVIVCAHGKVEV
jgi:hypothetical protein